jgi:hypothetical protein
VGMQGGEGAKQDTGAMISSMASGNQSNDEPSAVPLLAS